MAQTLHDLASRLPHERGASLLSLLDHGEGRLALEMIVDNLYEFEIVVSELERAALRELAQEYQLDQKVTEAMGLGAGKSGRQE
ncbi:MAG: MafI family immunity protein [Myxococcota bacterium]